jgi:triphosphoribosyl-dephospho-CoA synthase
MSDLMMSGVAVMQVRSPMHYTERRRRQRQQQAFCRHLALLAVRSLYQELTLHPKPGLVSLVDSGSHDDMDAGTFLRSLFALRHYFRAIAAAGMAGAAFGELKQLAISAEQRMLRATGGINTHRGAIFCVGMLCAAIAACRAQDVVLSPQSIRAILLIRWGDALMVHATARAVAATETAVTSLSNGLRVAAEHAVGGAREEGALGFPAVFETALPQLQATLASGRDWQCAKVDALFALMAQISDTNVYHRGGSKGAALVRERSRTFLQVGGTAAVDWRSRAQEMHRDFVRQRLSPGGAADLLAAACLVQAACNLDYADRVNHSTDGSH